MTLRGLTGIVTLSVLCSSALCACGDTGRERIEVPLFAAGAAPAPFDVRGWTVALDDARVGIGPLYFCAAASSSADLCPASVAEFTGSAELDALQPKREAIGHLDALTVDVRSAAWDFAITWPRSEAAPVVLDAAPGGHSAHFEGRADKDDVHVQFAADLDLVPLLRGTHEVQGVRTQASIADGIECELHLNAATWWSQVDFEDLADDPADDQGVIQIEPGSRAYEALTVAMTSSTPPTITWSD